MKRKWFNAQSLVLTATILYIFSLFMPWIDLPFRASANGLSQQGYLVLFLFVIPLYFILNEKSSRFFSVASSVAAVAFLIYYAGEANRTYQGEVVSQTGGGLYLSIFSAVLLVFAVFLNNIERKRYGTNGSVK
ncbi:hypothetical protein ACFO3D_08150 [Virgibacillus kekensis]|uniref:Uncharacterized protein n=2 Tax=Virgibacillus kekensis TaxID=202261 RepID=A0ABV9DHW6_9BACI